MSNTIFITANWTTGALSQQTISRQYDNNRYAVQFIGYPEGDGTEELDLYLLVWMSTAPGQKPGEITPIQLNSDQWYISNYFTQQVQVIKFQLCVLNEAGTYEAHSPIFSGRIGDSLKHDGTSQDIDVSTLFDAYREYLNELIIGAGAVIIDSVPTQGSNNAVSSGGVYTEFSTLKEDCESNFESIFDAYFMQSALTASKTIADRGLSNSGAVAYDADKTLRYYPVTAGDFLYLNLSANTGTTTAVWEFTSADTSISNYIVGSIHFDAIDGKVEVPTGATYLIVAQDESNTSFTVAEIIPKDFQGQISGIEDLIQGIAHRKYLTSLSWEQGWYNSSGTYSTADTHRFCTTNYIPIDADEEQYVQDTLSGYTMSIVYFDDNHEWKAITTERSDDRIYSIDSSYAYYKIQYYNASADIDDAENISAFIYTANTSAENSIVGRNVDKEVVVSNFSTSRPTHFADTYSPLEFIHFSDIHRQKAEWRNVCIYMDRYAKYIPFAIHTGDYCMTYNAQYTDLYAVRSPENGGYILNCVGNHDVYSNSSGTERATQAETYALLFNHISDWGVTFGEGDNIMYYYKDFADSGIRLIVLDIYYWDDTEKAWFDDLLADAITNNLQVITATHIATKKLPVANRVDCTFNVLDELGTASTGESDMVSAIEDSLLTFISNGGVHICNLCGHYHHDVVGYSQNDILNIAVECATHLPAGWDDAVRDTNTRAFDAFNVVAVDRTTGTIRIARIGNNSDCYGRGKNVLCYDYTNKAVIANY